METPINFNEDDLPTRNSFPTSMTSHSEDGTVVQPIVMMPTHYFTPEVSTSPKSTGRSPVPARSEVVKAVHVNNVISSSSVNQCKNSPPKETDVSVNLSYVCDPPVSAFLEPQEELLIKITE